MSVDVSKLEGDLVSEIKLEPLQAKVYLLVNCHGKMSAKTIAGKLNISDESASKTANELMELGAFIDMPADDDGGGDAYEAMHPRFTAVNMYKKYCERENVEFRRNKTVDNIGAVLETPYEDARTK